MRPLSAPWERPPTRVTPEEIKLQIRALIRRYCRQRSVALALRISDSLQALCVHPRHAITEAERCAYRRLARHWRGLAWVGENPIQAMG